MEPKPIVELHTFYRHPTDKQLQHRYIFLATTIICSLSALNYNIEVIRITVKDRILRRRALCIAYEDELSINDYRWHYERNIEFQQL